MATPKVIPISQKQLNQNHVPLIVSYTSADQKKSIAQLKLNNVSALKKHFSLLVFTKTFSKLFKIHRIKKYKTLFKPI